MASVALASLLLIFGSIVSGCPPAFSTWYDGICLQLNFGGTNPSMRAQCEGQGAEMASIHSASENEYMRGIVFSSAQGKDLRLGIRCDPDTGEFAWYDGRPVNYTNFADSKPCDRSSIYYMDRADGKWFAGIPQQYHAYACMLPHKSNSPCDEFDQVGDSATCVKIHTSQASWQRTESICASANAHLVSIHDAEVNSLIHNQLVGLDLTDGVHIGLTYNSSTKSVAWVDGSAVDYSNYDKGFPNDKFGLCMAMASDGGWMSISCATTYLPFICGRPAFLPKVPLGPATCGKSEQLTGRGELFSPTYPLGYAADSSCTYMLVGPPTGYVELFFDDFETNECCDSLTIYDGAAGDNVIATLTGSNLGKWRRYRTKKTNVMRLEWRTSSGVGVRGWHARFYSIAPMPWIPLAPQHP